MHSSNMSVSVLDTTGQEAKLATDYALQTDADLVETIYDCSPDKCITFLERHFSFNAFETMKWLMVRLIVFGKFLAKNFRED